MDSPIRKLVFVASLVAGFVMVGDGLAMSLPGPSSGAGGAALLGLGAVWLARVVPAQLSAAGRPFAANVIARFGMVIAPPLALVMACIWWLATPAALSIGFAVAWSGVWVVCLALSAFLPCPRCRRPYGRRGARLQTASSECPHCGANPRGPAA